MGVLCLCLCGLRSVGRIHAYDRMCPVSADFLAMWTFAIGSVHFATEYAVWRTVGRGVGLGMAVGVPGMTLIWMSLGWYLGWYGK